MKLLTMTHHLLRMQSRCLAVLTLLMKLLNVCLLVKESLPCGINRPEPPTRSSRSLRWKNMIRCCPNSWSQDWFFGIMMIGSRLRQGMVVPFQDDTIDVHHTTNDTGRIHPRRIAGQENHPLRAGNRPTRPMGPCHGSLSLWNSPN